MRQNQIAHKTLAAVRGFKSHKDAAQLKTLCKKAPSILQQSGLSQTIAFLRTRNHKTGSGEAFIEAAIRCLPSKPADLNVYQERAHRSALVDYMEMTAELQQVLVWMRRFAQVELVDVKEDPQDD